jgi:hypothetical protein
MPLMEGHAMDLDLINDYRRKYVVFLDLLGFRELVKRSGQDVLERHRLVEALKLVRDTLAENPAIDFRFTYFSDCIVLSAERSPGALWQIFQSIELLTFNLLQYDVLARGGLAVGPTHHSKDFIFGTAVTEAYEQESQLASNPIVLLSPQVAQEAIALGPDFGQWLKEDGPDRFFVNYLMRYAAYTSNPEAGKVILTHPAKRVAHFIGKRLVNDQGGVLKKAEWFQRYWNDSVASRSVLPRIEIEAANTELEQPPTIIFRRLIAPVTARQ